MNAPPTARQIGRSLPRLEARAKVSGRAEYTHTMRLPGMLIAKIFRSTVPHGRIKSVDVSAARELPGVFGVYTGEDVENVIPDPYYGPGRRPPLPISSTSKAPRTPIARSTSNCGAATSTRPSRPPCRSSSTRSKRRKCYTWLSSRTLPSPTTATTA
ncbi:MAG: hypothetical protein P8Y53_03075 [Pseudolabrys sp.]